MTLLYKDFMVLSQYKDSLSRYSDSHYKDKLVVRLSNLFNGNPYTGKMTSLYWDGSQTPLATAGSQQDSNELIWLIYFAD